MLLNQPGDRKAPVRALVLAPFSDDELVRLRCSVEVCYESWFDTRRLQDPDELASRLTSGGTAILVVESDFVFEDLFDAVECLEMVGVCRGSTHQVDVEAATRCGVAVVNAPGRNAQAVAEHVLGLMLALARRIPEAHAYVVDGRWQNPAQPYIEKRGVELAGRTLGVVGLGAIGKRLASLAGAIGMRVIAHDPYVEPASTPVDLTDLDSLMAESDFVAVLAPPTAETEGMLDAGRIALMRPAAFMVIASSTSVVSQSALVDALTQRRIAGAALDVFDTHPVAADSPLLRPDNVVLTPHLGGATEETIERHSRMIVDDIERFLRGERPVNLVNPEVWDRRG